MTSNQTAPDTSLRDKPWHADRHDRRTRDERGRHFSCSSLHASLGESYFNRLLRQTGASSEAKAGASCSCLDHTSDVDSSTARTNVGALARTSLISKHERAPARLVLRSAGTFSIKSFQNIDNGRATRSHYTLGTGAQPWTDEPEHAVLHNIYTLPLLNPNAHGLTAIFW